MRRTARRDRRPLTGRPRYPSGSASRRRTSEAPDGVREGGDAVVAAARPDLTTELLELLLQPGRELRELGASDRCLDPRTKPVDGGDKRSETLVVPGRLDQGANLLQPRVELRREALDLASLDESLEPPLQPVELVTLDRAIRTRRQPFDHTTQLDERVLDRRRLHQGVNLIDTCTQSRCELIDVGTADRVVETILNHAEVRAQLGNAVDEGGDPVFLRGRVGAPAELLEPGAELGRERRQLGAGDGLLGVRAKLLDGPDKRSETLVVPDDSTGHEPRPAAHRAAP